MHDERPHGAEYALLAFLVVALVLNSFFLFSPPTVDDPFSKYADNIGIRAIYTVAVVFDLAVISVLFTSLVRRRFTRLAQAIIGALVLAVAVWPWVELWYGSTFYYGEVRDKQGLPFGANHFGVIGTFAALTYVALRIPLPRRMRMNEQVWRTVVVVSVAAAEYLAWHFVYERWNLWQS